MESTATQEAERELRPVWDLGLAGIRMYDSGLGVWGLVLGLRT